MESIVPLLTIVYFVTIILALYHLHQQELERIGNRLDQLSESQNRGNVARTMNRPANEIRRGSGA
jgi:hypothetical protein